MASPFGQSGVAAVNDLGLGGLLDQQQKDETDEQRRKRLAGTQDEPGTSAAVKSLFGSLGGLGSGLGALGGRGVAR
jgi:hypothetical protein